MPIDSVPLPVPKSPDDLMSIFVDIGSHAQYKFLLMMFIVFIIVNSDVFINRILSNFKNATDYKYPTNWGVLLQGLFLVIIMLSIDILIRQKVI